MSKNVLKETKAKLAALIEERMRGGNTAPSEIDVGMEVLKVRVMLRTNLHPVVYDALFRSDALLANLYDATRGYRGARMPLAADGCLNKAFDEARKYLNAED